MKFYRYPLSIIAYALLGIYLFAVAYHWLGGKVMDDYWLYFPAGAGIYLLIAFVLSKLNIQWEWDVAIQVAFVLGPVLWYVNQREPYKRPEYIFVVRSGYTGPLTIYFSQSEDAKTNVRSTADTLYFRFDDRGEIQLNEEADYVQQSMEKNLFYLYADRTKRRVTFAPDTLQLPADTTKAVLVKLAPETEKGRMKVLHYRLQHPQQR